MHDLGKLFFAAAVRPGNQHRQIRACDLTGETERGLGQRVGMDESAQIVFDQRRPSTPIARIATRQLLPRLRQLQQIVDCHHQLAVVPRFGQIIGGAGFHQLHRRRQVRPRGQQNHRQIGMTCADFAEQRLAFFTRRGVGLEVHVLHDQIHRRLRKRGQPLFRIDGDARVDIVQRKQRFQRCRDRRVVVDNQDGGHRVSVTQSGKG